MKFLITISMVLFSTAALAKTHLTCDGGRNYEPGTKIRVLANIRGLEVSEDKKEATISSYNLSLIIEDQDSNGIVPHVQVGALNGSSRSNLPYSGRKYKGHLKFDLDGSLAGNAPLEYAYLIVSPEYKVVKRIDHQNMWNPEIKWVEEIREHSAVMDISLDDHHGDYMPMKCWSRESIRN